MVSPEDFIKPIYTPDLTQAGITFACKTMPLSPAQTSGSIYPRLRHTVAEVVVELAFRRYLDQEKIPHQHLAVTPFSDPERSEIAIGGRRCEIKTVTLSRKSRIRLVRSQPRALLNAHALVQENSIASSHHNDEDLFIFAFFSALVTPNYRSLQRALVASQPVYLIHALPMKWSKPGSWRSLGAVSLKGNLVEPVEVHLGGQGRDRKNQTSSVWLEPNQTTRVKQDFFALHYLHPDRLPEGDLGVHSPVLAQTFLVPPVEWSNLWVYGLQIFFTGFVPRGEYRRKATRLPVGSRAFQLNRASRTDLALPIAELHPLQDLFTRARTWF